MFKTVTKTFAHTAALLLVLLLAACQPIPAVSVINASGVTAATVMGASDQKPCTLATLKGRYLFAGSGTILPPAFGVTEPTPGADAGFHIFNGDGTGTDTVTVRVGSKIALENFVTPFSYIVNADCTGSITVPNGPSFNLFTSPKGDTFAEISTAPEGNYVARIDQRVSDK